MFGPPITNIGVKKGFCFNSLLSDVTKINPKGNGSLTRYAVFYPEEDEDDNGDDENNTQHMVHDYDMFLPMTFHILTKTNQGIL